MVIKKRGNKYYIKCAQCGRQKKFAAIHNARLAIARGTCISCNRGTKVRRFLDIIPSLEKAPDGMWSVRCPSCKMPRNYKRLDHAKAAAFSSRNCRRCSLRKISNEKWLYHENIRVAIFNKYKRSATDRDLTWELEIDHILNLWISQSGRCALSGIKLSDERMKETYSLDRIDSSRGYFPDNVQLVHKTINMMKGSLKDEEFSSWCRRVARCRTKSA